MVSIAASAVILCAGSTALAKNDDLFTIVEKGKSACVIVTPDSASEPEKYAASELQANLEKMSGARLEIASETQATGSCKLLIGNTKQGGGIVGDEELSKLGDDGFVIRAADGALALRGASGRAVLYAVYSMLEDDLGVRWYAPDETYVPKREDVAVKTAGRTEKAGMEYREAYFCLAYDGDWATRNRLNGQHHRLDEKHGGRVKYVQGFVHTLAGLVPADKYFAEHPEYYSEIDGKRIPNGQICLTNPEVLEVVKARVLEIAGQTGGAPSIISVSQNDNMLQCRCPKCRAMDNEEGSPAGTLLRFVNEIADAVAEKYPNVVIDTLAYQYTENAPRITRPRPNVVVRLCHMAPSCDLHPLGKCFWNGKYVKNLKAWSKMSNRLYVWHYVTDFAHYYLPFPNINAISKDIAFYSKYNVRGMFAQGVSDCPGGDMPELKTWLISKLLWNPNADSEALIAEFMKGYYKQAEPAVTEYLNVLRKRVRNPLLHANLYSPPQAGYLDAATLAAMSAALERADKLAAGDPVISERVRRIKLLMLYTKLAAPELFVKSGKLTSADKKQLPEIYRLFESEIKHFNVTGIREGEQLDLSLNKLRTKAYGLNF